ncbi:acyl-CoA thioesterase [Inquilinus sp. CAU 1745]|uniref:acyl-CoA thioesterase n=1 Tax=Inquilinus sp. CAU 1745 TaxID=3140369 RepID=UPI00325BABB3
MPEHPSGQLTLRTIAMPADANPNGDIFGGWLLAQMDLAGSVLAYDQADGRVATIAIDAMSFLAPVMVGDLVSCYAEIERIGNTSIRVKVETYATRRAEHELIKVTEGMVTYVAIDEDRKPRPVPKG